MGCRREMRSPLKPSQSQAMPSLLNEQLTAAANALEIATTNIRSLALNATDSSQSRCRNVNSSFDIDNSTLVETKRLQDNRNSNDFDGYLTTDDNESLSRASLNSH